METKSDYIDKGFSKKFHFKVIPVDNANNIINIHDIILSWGTRSNVILL